jgi:hypothetical protein
VDGDYVLRGLAGPGQKVKREKRLKVTQEQAEIDYLMPEKRLWLAVIDRAIKDYVGFFYKISGNNSNNSILGYKCDNTMSVPRCLAELTRLEDFFFCEEPKEFNLVYLADFLFDEPDGMVSSIQKCVTKDFQTHCETMKQQGKYADIIDFIIRNARDPMIDWMRVKVKYDRRCKLN